MNTKPLSLRELSIVITLLLAMAITFGYGTLQISSQVEEIDTSWQSFKAQHAEQARLTNGLHGALPSEGGGS